jgi:hypothetical protein
VDVIEPGRPKTGANLGGGDFFCWVNSNICDHTSDPVPPMSPYDVLASGGPTLGDLSSGRLADYSQSTQTLSVYYSDPSVKPGTAVITDSLDLQLLVGSQVYLGFTGGTSSATRALARHPARIGTGDRADCAEDYARTSALARFNSARMYAKPYAVCAAPPPTRVGEWSRITMPSKFTSRSAFMILYMS